jgi:Tfp pilus assembly protein PilF
MKVALRYFGVAALAAIVGLGASAQLSKGFRGRVLTMEGKGIPGVTVVLQDEANPNNHYEVKTDSGGVFVYTGLPYSDKGYTVTAQIPNFPPIIKIEKPKLLEMTEITMDPRKGVGFQGTVKDKAGKIVSGAKVTFVNLADESKPYNDKTDGKGVYRKVDLPYTEKGYRISCEIPGEEKPLTKTVSITQISILEVGFNFGAPDEPQGGGAPVASKAADAKQMFELGDYEGAVGKADEAIAGADNVKVAKLIKASSLRKLDRTDEAIAAFEDYNKDNPGDLNILGELYNLCDKKGDKSKADFYKKEFMAKGGQIQGQTYNDGVRALNDGDAQKAADLFQQAIRENPGDPDCHRELARAFAQQGKFAETIGELKAYLKMKPNAEDAETWKQAITGLEQAIQQQNKKK